ncbi:hypothetical protein [Phaeobacter italicus]|jgi:hypothetical protein|uniref:hypothetical protein n=1 Tax=Phaeobacter italicus TaxID=481446 RepID=UPI002FDE4D67
MQTLINALAKPAAKGWQVPHSVNLRIQNRCTLSEWLVTPLHGGAMNYAVAAFLVLRALAA